MFKKIIGKDPYAVRVFLSDSVAEKLRSSCFRGGGLKLAGNFARWDSPRGLFDEGLVERRLAEQLSLLAKAGRYGDQVVTITCNEYIGWDFIVPAAKVPDRYLEIRGTSHGHFVRVNIDCRSVRAPRTRLVSFGINFTRDGSLSKGIIHDVTPGGCVGRFSRVLDVNGGLAVLEWDHLGE